MSRRRSATSRHPGPTETEIALQWELRRLRKENDKLRETNAGLSRETGALTPPERAVLIRKIANMWRNGVLHRLMSDPRCPHCHGWTEEEAEVAFEEWAQETETHLH